MSSAGTAARACLRHYRAGTLATLSQRLAGYPFGSAVPFVLDHAARPVILVSRLAEHTRNIAADHRVSLHVSSAAGDVQAGTRLTLVGDAARATWDLSALRARYLRYFPDAERFRHRLRRLRSPRRRRTAAFRFRPAGFERGCRVECAHRGGEESPGRVSPGAGAVTPSGVR